MASNAFAQSEPQKNGYERVGDVIVNVTKTKMPAVHDTLSQLVEDLSTVNLVRTNKTDMLLVMTLLPFYLKVRRTLVSSKNADRAKYLADNTVGCVASHTSANGSQLIDNGICTFDQWSDVLQIHVKVIQKSSDIGQDSRTLQDIVYSSENMVAKIQELDPHINLVIVEMCDGSKHGDAWYSALFPNAKIVVFE